MQADEIIRISGTNPKKCMNCGKCTAICPLQPQEEWEQNISTHKFAKRISQNNLKELLDSDTIWNCMSCLSCVEKCPRGVEPANLINAMCVAQLQNEDEPFISTEKIMELEEDEDDIPQQLLVAAIRKYNS